MMAETTKAPQDLIRTFRTVLLLFLIWRGSLLAFEFVGIHLTFEAKVPDERETRRVMMDFHYRHAFGEDHLPDAYERLLLDAIKGDASLFARADTIETSWRLIDPILDGWQSDPAAPPLATYAPGSWGPAEADELLGRNGDGWQHQCGEHA